MDQGPSDHHLGLLDARRTAAEESRAAYSFYKKTSCANCLNTKVVGSPEAPVVYCTKGHGQKEVVDLFQGGVRGFRKASHCPDRAFFPEDD